MLPFPVLEVHMPVLPTGGVLLDFPPQKLHVRRMRPQPPFSKRNQLRAMAKDCDAIILLGKRYAEYARELAANCDDLKRKEELLQIAANCDIVPAHKPQTYWQAIQMYWFVHLAVTSELNPWDAYSPGRLDQHLYPFYQKDMTEGILDD